MKRLHVGLVAQGRVAVGIVAMGGIAIGIVAIGGVSLGLVAIGGIALGGLAMGAVVLGFKTVGAISLGVVGAVAVASMIAANGENSAAGGPGGGADLRRTRVRGPGEAAMRRQSRRARRWVRARASSSRSGVPSGSP